MRGGRVGVVLSVAAAIVACGSSSTRTAAPPRDGGTMTSGDGAAPDATACGNGDLFCGGMCQTESVDVCGPSCTRCPQPASSHGAADCQGSQCTLSCDGGYARCATQSCCGTQTLGDVVEIRVGSDSSCGVTTGGSVWCWGDDDESILGDNSPGSISMLPVQIASLPPTAHVTMGDHHVCALLVDKTVACWGADEQGQLGDGLNISRGTPEPTGSLPDVVALAGGSLFTCALTGDGDVSCWGSNSAGQIGVPTGAASITTPTQVQGLSSAATAIAAGGAFACALVGGGTVQCWGDGSSGQLGGPASSYEPVSVTLPSAAVAVAAGSDHACAVLASGGVVCWGRGSSNQLGSTQPSIQATPVVVPGVSGATLASAGGDETCIIDHGGGVTCWGADPIGDQGGLGPAGPAGIPSLTGGVVTLGVTTGHACATTSGNAPKCWGTNESGDLGDNTLTASWAPIDVMDF